MKFENQVKTEANRPRITRLDWKKYEAGVTVIERNVNCYELIIAEGAELVAPKGKYLTLLIDGIVREIRPGDYMGDIRLVVKDLYVQLPSGMNRLTQCHRFMNMAVAVKDNEIIEDCSVLDAVNDGEVTGTGAKDIYIAADRANFNGILVAGNSDYTIDNARIYLEGEGKDDFVGVGAGVTAADNAHVTINDSDICLSGATRCAVHVGGNSRVEVNSCRLSNVSPDTDRLYGFSWQLGISGSNRLCQLCDNGQVVYNNCDIYTNGWGGLSIDGGDEHVEIYLKDSRLRLVGPRARGYGSFCIGEYPVTFDHSDVLVDGYGMLVMGMEGLGRPSIINGTKISGRFFGTMVMNDDNSIYTMKDSSIATRRSSIVVKSSATKFDIENMQFNPGNGVVLQLQDSEEMGMDSIDYRIPVGVKDTYTEGRDLYTADELYNVVLNIKNSDIKGNFFNSTTDLRYMNNSMRGMFPSHAAAAPEFPEGFTPPRFEDFHEDGLALLNAPILKRHNGDDLRGAKNLGMDLTDTRITGIISSAEAKYRDGLFVIDQRNCQEISNIIQTAAPTVNNGVVISLDGSSEWVVTGTSYITSLTLAEGALVSAPEGKTIKMTVNGVDTDIAPGRYQGMIVLSIGE